MVQAVLKTARGQSVVYTSGHDCQFVATVITAHQDATSTIRVQWPIRESDEAVLLGCFQGERYRVENERLSPRTRRGKPISQLKEV